jgi:hypothetical protein
VEIDSSAEPLPYPEAAERVGRSLAASVDLGPDRPPGGGLDPDFRLEDLDAATLTRALDEACLQGHLLTHSFLLTVARRWGDEAAREIGGQQFTGVAGVVAMRLARAFDLDIAGVLELHPAFHPSAYVARSVEGNRFTIGDCPALHENGGWSWPALLGDDVRPLEAIVQAVDPRATVRADGALAWTWTVDPAAPPAKERNEVTLTKFSTGADFVFAEH